MKDSLKKLDTVLNKINKLGSIAQALEHYKITKQGLYRSFRRNGFKLIQSKKWEKIKCDGKKNDSQ